MIATGAGAVPSDVGGPLESSYRGQLTADAE